MGLGAVGWRALAPTAHLGAAKALRQLGVPMDFLAGTSDGRGDHRRRRMAAGFGTFRELDHRIRQAFVESEPASPDIAFPLLAMTRGQRVDNWPGARTSATRKISQDPVACRSPASPQIPDVRRPIHPSAGACFAAPLRRASLLSLPGRAAAGGGGRPRAGGLGPWCAILPVDVVREQHGRRDGRRRRRRRRGLKPDRPAAAALRLALADLRRAAQGPTHRLGADPLRHPAPASRPWPPRPRLPDRGDHPGHVRGIELAGLERLRLRPWRPGYRATMEAAERLARRW